jgi:glycosyltransferase involved in cell wall biosynthesis
MKLTVFTPAIKASSIGGCSSVVSRELRAQGHRVAVVRTEIEGLLESETHDFGVPVLPWTKTDRVMKAAQDADALIYQIGDNYDFHQGGLEWLARLPGVVILHDFFLGHLFLSWAQSDRARAIEILRIWYGEETARAFFGYPDQEAFIQGTRDTAPMTEWVCSMAQAVVTHSSWGCERVLNSCAGPVRVVALTHNKELSSDSLTTRGGSSDSERLVILTMGHVNPNKRAASVIQAIGNSPLLRERSTYHLVGAIRPGTVHELTRLAEANGVDLVISGEVDDQALIRAIGESDVISCLRWPSLEAASGSLVEALLSGKPTIVVDTGFYREIPSSCVLKVTHENEIADLQTALELLLKDPNRRRAIGAEGQRWASKTFTAGNYVRELIDTVEDAMKAVPVLNAIDYFSRILGGWSVNHSFAHYQGLTEPLGVFKRVNE